MTDKNDPKHQAGYKEPPRHTQFKKGQSGNPKGRPKKAKTVEEVLRKELAAYVTISEGGKRWRITKLEAILRHLIHKAAGGDARIAAMLLNELRSHKFDEGDNLPELLRQFRAIDARHAAEEQH